MGARISALCRRGEDKRFRPFIEESDDVFWITDLATGRVLYVSPAYERVWGRSAERLLQHEDDWLDAIHPEDRGRVAAAFTHAVEGRYDEEYRIRRPDGVDLWIRDRGRVLRDANGRPFRLIGVAENITVRKRAENALRESEARWRALFESASQGVLAVDASGRIVLVNAKTEELFCYTRGELVGQQVEVLVPENLRDIHTRHRTGYFEHPRSRYMGLGLDLLARRRDGTMFPVEISLSYVSEGETRIALAMITDITQRKRFEQRLLESAKLESLGVLAGGIAHDFNNLLTGILGNASMALGALPAQHPARRFLEGVIHAGERASHLTGQMLAYSGKGRFVVQPVDLSEFIDQMLELIRSSVHRTVRLDVDLARGLPPIEADAAQLQQLLMNLVINAAEAVGERPGRVAIRAGAHHFEKPPGDLAPGTHVFLEVSDSGSGMDEATRARIFEPFFTTKFVGRGLGLAAVLGIVRGHQAAITVESAPGRGSTFTVVFPPAPARTQPREGADQTAERACDIRGAILVVDDEEIVRRTARDVLEAHGYPVLLADNGSEAADLFRRMEPEISLVLLDLTMPVMSGQETYRELKAIRPEIPIILSSGYTEADAVSRFEGMQLAGFLQKPFTASQLLEKIRSATAAAVR